MAAITTQITTMIAISAGVSAVDFPYTAVTLDPVSKRTWKDCAGVPIDKVAKYLRVISSYCQIQEL